MGFRKLAIWAIALVIFICVAAPVNAGEEKRQYKYTWKYATLAPKDIGWAIHIQELFFPLIDELSDGNIRLKIYWGGVLGDDEDFIKRMHTGQLNGAGLSGQGVTIAIPEMAVLELPFLFTGYDEVDYIRKKMMPAFDRLADRRGYFIIGLIDQDFDQIYSVSYDMTKVEHFRKAKFYTWYGPLEENMLASLGASPVPINVPEISATVRQGLVDSGIGPAIWQVGAQMHSVWNFVNPAKIRYSPALMIQNADDFKGSRELALYRKRILERRDEFVRQFVTRTRAENEKCLKAMTNYGMTMAEMDEKNLDEFKKLTRPVWNKMVGKLYSRQLLDEVLEHIEEFRAGK